MWSVTVGVTLENIQIKCELKQGRKETGAKDTAIGKETSSSHQEVNFREGFSLVRC